MKLRGWDEVGSVTVPECCDACSEWRTTTVFLQRTLRLCVPTQYVLYGNPVFSCDDRVAVL